MRELALQCYVAFSMSVSKLSCMWQFIMANEYMRYLLWFVCACHCNSVHAPDRFHSQGKILKSQKDPCEDSRLYDRTFISWCFFCSFHIWFSSTTYRLMSAFSEPQMHTHTLTYTGKYSRPGGKHPHPN